MEIVKLTHHKIGIDSVIIEYNEPIEMGKVKLADGIFLVDKDFGLMFGVKAKEIDRGVYQDTSFNKLFMYEEGVKQ